MHQRNPRPARSTPSHTPLTPANRNAVLQRTPARCAYPGRGRGAAGVTPTGVTHAARLHTLRGHGLAPYLPAGVGARVRVTLRGSLLRPLAL
eukprot:scaffold36666_cov43-Phaeocystis_antarctica.AAC.4